MMVLRLLTAVLAAFLLGKLVSKLKLPAILGWLLAGMLLGPYAIGVINHELLEAQWYETLINILECSVGLMIGTELVWKKIKSTGKQIVVTTLTQSMGAFLVVSAVFGVVFYFTGTPLYLALIFGSIALATAPAPALSIVREFGTDGPVTKTLIPLAALDDMIAVVVFFTVISVTGARLSGESVPLYMILAVILLPIVIGIATGLIGGLVLKKSRSAAMTNLLLGVMLLLSWAVGFAVKSMSAQGSMINFMLIGMSFSATFANMISEERLNEIMAAFSPILGISMIVVILNLGTPLDYHLILGAGVFTAVYIIGRAVGKYTGAYVGASITKSEPTVKRYLGLTLLPHSGVSLVFTGIAASSLAGPAPECAAILQGTIAAAAVINEVIAVVLAKKAFEWAGELGQKSIAEAKREKHI